MENILPGMILRFNYREKTAFDKKSNKPNLTPRSADIFFTSISIVNFLYYANIRKDKWV